MALNYWHPALLANDPFAHCFFNVILFDQSIISIHITIAVVVITYIINHDHQCHQSTTDTVTLINSTMTQMRLILESHSLESAHRQVFERFRDVWLAGSLTWLVHSIFLPFTTCLYTFTFYISTFSLLSFRYVCLSDCFSGMTCAFYRFSFSPFTIYLLHFHLYLLHFYIFTFLIFTFGDVWVVCCFSVYLLHFYISLFRFLLCFSEKSSLF